MPMSVLWIPPGATYERNRPTVGASATAPFEPLGSTRTPPDLRDHPHRTVPKLIGVLARSSHNSNPSKAWSAGLGGTAQVPAREMSAELSQRGTRCVGRAGVLGYAVTYTVV